MAQRICCLFQLYSFIIAGLVIVHLNVSAGANSTIVPTPASATTAPSSTVIHSTVPPAPVNPATGYGHFNVSGKDGKPCLLLDISCSITLQLSNKITYDLPLNAVSSGTCGEKMSNVTLAWEKGSENLTLSMTFMTADDKWKMTSLSFTFINGSGFEVSAVQSDSEKLMMTANKDKSFKCTRSLDIALEGKVEVTVNVKKIEVQPFGGDFGEAEVCSSKPGGNPAQPVDSIVPTIVGCVLAGLIIILIITYFVGRCKKTGYEKM